MNDEQWLSELFHENYTLLYRTGMVFLTGKTQTDLIEEQIQETFLLAWKKRELVKQHPNPQGWLVETFRHCLQHSCRKQVREFKHRVFDRDEYYYAEALDSQQDTVEQILEAGEQIEQLYRLLGKRDADIFIRFCLHHDKAEEIGQTYGISGAAVRMCVSRVRKKVINNKTLFMSLTIFIYICLKGGK